MEFYKSELNPGWKFIEKTEKTDFYKAQKILFSRKYRKYSEAVIKEDRVDLKRHILRCPFCGKEIPAYDFRIEKNPKKVRKFFGNMELFFDENGSFSGIQEDFSEFEEKRLFIQKPVKPYFDIQCPKCERSAKLSSEKVDFSFGIKENGVFVSLLKNDFSVSETFFFDFSHREVFHKFETEDGKTLFSENAEDCLEKINPLFENRIVTRRLKNLFEDFTKSCFPFSSNELSLRKFVLFTKFTGFPREFYHAIPFDENGELTDESFSDICEKIRNPESAMIQLKKSFLPDMKSVRKIFVENPGLFFYITEAEKLFSSTSDINYFCDILKDKNIFFLLALLHIYPGLAGFFSDFAAAKNHKSLLKSLRNCPAFMFGYGINYSALSDSGKKSEQKKWKVDKNFFINYGEIMLFPTPSFSFPLSTSSFDIPDIRIGEYSFSLLRNLADYRKAGKDLNNCLGKSILQKGAVVVMYRNGKALAAAEVFEKKVVCVLAKNNESINDFPPLKKAFEEWRRKTGFQY